MEIRSLDFLHAIIGPDGQVPSFLRQGREDPAQKLADGAIQYHQGEYLWPLAMQGRPLPEGEVPLPSGFTSVHLAEAGVAVMRSDWGARAHYMAIDGAGNFVLHAYGQELACGCDPALGREGGQSPLWSTGLFLDALGAAGSATSADSTTRRAAVLFVKPVGDLPGYWLIADGGALPPSQPGLQVVQAPLGATLLAPYDRFPSQLGPIKIDAWDAEGARCYRIVHALGYDLLVIGDGAKREFEAIELTTDGRFALIRVRGHQVGAHQLSRGTILHFRGEELA